MRRLSFRIARFHGMAVAALLGAGSAAAQDQSASILAGACVNCHSSRSAATNEIPSIAGQPYAVLLAQLNAFRAGEDPRATVMTRHARGYSDEELAALARYFSELAP